MNWGLVVKELYMDKCEMCGEEAVDTHHIKEQQTADDNDMIGAELAEANTIAEAARNKATTELKTEWGQAYDQKIAATKPYVKMTRQNANGLYKKAYQAAVENNKEFPIFEFSSHVFRHSAIRF